MERQNAARVQKPVTTNKHVQRQPVGNQPSQSAQHPLVQLQRSIGNQATQRLIGSQYIQTKLKVSTPGDPFEQEADRVADTVMRMPDTVDTQKHPSRIQTKPLASQITPLIHRQVAPQPTDEEEEVVAGKPILQLVPLAVRDDEDEEEKVAREVDTRPGSQEEEKEKTITPKLESAPPIQRQSTDEDKDEEPLSVAPAIQRQLEEEEDEEVAPKLFRQLSPNPVVSVAPQRSSTNRSLSESKLHLVPIQRVCTECEEEIQRQPETVDREADSSLSLSLQREAISRVDTGAEEEEETIEAQAYQSSSGQSSHSVAGSLHSPASSGVESHIASSRGSGSPLSRSSISFFEPRFGSDLSAVRVHTDSSAANAARQLRAQAFTTGSDIYFGTGLYQPETAQGQRLLAHELTHVLQQNPGRMVQRQPANRPFVIQRDPDEETDTEEVTPLDIGEDEDIPIPEVKDDESELTEEEMGPEYVPGEEEEIDIPAFDTGDKGCPELIPEKLITEEKTEEDAGGGSDGDVFARLLEIAASGPGFSISPGIPGLGGLAGFLGISITGVVGRGALWAWRKLPLSVRAWAINKAIDLALAGTEFFPVELLAASGVVMVWMRAGLLGFLRRLKREDDASKVEMFEKYLEIILGQSATFLLGYLKGLLWGFFVDGLVGIIQMVIDLVCLVLKIPQFIESLKKLFGAFPEEMEKLGQSIQETAAAIELAVTHAADEILEIASDPSRVIGLIQTVIEAGEVSSEKMGDAIAEKLIEFSKQPSAVIGKQLGRATGVILFEIVLALVTAGGGLAVSTVKVATKVVIKLFAKLGRYVFHLIKLIKPIFQVFRNFLGSCKKFLTKLLSAVASKLQKAFEAFEEFIEKILKRCRPGSLKCKVPKKRSKKARILAQIKVLKARIKVLLRLQWLRRGTVTGPGGSFATSHPLIANVTKAERKKVNKAGAKYGDHHTGVKSPGTTSKEWIPDHQPVTELVGMAKRSSVLRGMMTTARMPTTLASQRLYPHSLTSARIQGGTVTAIALKLAKLARLKRKIR